MITTNPAQRNYKVAALVGIIGGFFSAIVKFGWEVPFPPRTPERNATNPPQSTLELLGMSPEASHTSVTYNGNALPIHSFFVRDLLRGTLLPASRSEHEGHPVAGCSLRHCGLRTVSRSTNARPWHCSRALESAFRRALLGILRTRCLVVVHRDCPSRSAQPDHRRT